jgi:hypothetical protein
MKYLFHAVAMGIKKNQTSLGFNILNNKIFQKCRFPDTSFADDIHVKQPVGWLDAEYVLGAPKIGFGDSEIFCSHEASIIVHDLFSRRGKI